MDTDDFSNEEFSCDENPKRAAKIRCRWWEIRGHFGALVIKLVNRNKSNHQNKLKCLNCACFRIFLWGFTASLCLKMLWDKTKYLPMWRWTVWSSFNERKSDFHWCKVRLHLLLCVSVHDTCSGGIPQPDSPYLNPPSPASTEPSRWSHSKHSSSCTQNNLQPQSSTVRDRQLIHSQEKASVERLM